MSGGTKTVRQPGGKRPFFTTGHYPCGVCKSGCMPKGLSITLNGFQALGGCCADLNGLGGRTYSLSPVSSVSDNCNRSNSDSPECLYSNTVSACGFDYLITATIRCVDTGGGNFVLEVDVEISATGAATPATVALGSWQSATLTGGCGSADCSALSASGTFTTFDSGYCALNGQPEPTWSLSSSGCDDCRTVAGVPCCCGGQPPARCYRLCMNGGACSALSTDLHLCLNKATGKYETSSGSSVQAKLTDSSGSFTLEWSCDNWSTSGSYTFAAGEASHIDGGLQLNATVPDHSGCCTDGTAIVIQAGPFVRCQGICSTDCFGATPLSADWDVYIGANLTNDIWDSCSVMGGIFTIVQGAGTAPGSLCNWGGRWLIGDIVCGKTCGACACASLNLPGNIPSCGVGIDMGLFAVEGGCQFQLSLYYGCKCTSDSGGGNTNCEGTGAYTSEVFPLGSAPPTSLVLTGGGTSGSCIGSLPSSITLDGA